MKKIVLLVAMGLGMLNSVAYSKHHGKCQPLDIYLDNVDVVHHFPSIDKEIKKDIIKLLVSGVILYDLKSFSNYIRDIRLNEKQISAFHRRSLIFCCLLKFIYFSVLASDGSDDFSVLIAASVFNFLSNENTYWAAEETTKTVWNKLMQGVRATGSGAKKVVGWMQQKVSDNEELVDQIV